MLIREHLDKYLNTRFDYNFINENEFNSDLAYYDHDKSGCQKLINTLNKTKEEDKDLYSRFGLYCLSKFVSYNEARKLFNKKYILDFSKIEKYRGYKSTMYYQFKDLFWSDDITFRDLTTRFVIYKYNEYSYSDDTLDIDFCKGLLRCEDYDKESYFNSDKEILGPNIYMVIKWLISQNKLTIIDKTNYIMFFFNDQKEFHLCRTKDNDVYFREEDFDDAINIIFDKLL